MNVIDPQQLLIGTGSLALLGYIAKLVIPNLLNKIDTKDAYIQKLTETFTETINHKTTEWTAAMNRLAEAQEKQVNLFEKIFKRES